MTTVYVFCITLKKEEEKKKKEKKKKKKKKKIWKEAPFGGGGKRKEEKKELRKKIGGHFEGLRCHTHVAATGFRRSSSASASSGTDLPLLLPFCCVVLCSVSVIRSCDVFQIVG